VPAPKMPRVAKGSAAAAALAAHKKRDKDRADREELVGQSHRDRIGQLIIAAGLTEMFPEVQWGVVSEDPLIVAPMDSSFLLALRVGRGRPEVRFVRGTEDDPGSWQVGGIVREAADVGEYLVAAAQDESPGAVEPS
jgi:hypothetical protein